MKQSTLLGWIETAESARFCRLAEEDLLRFEPTPARILRSNPLLASLRGQLCLGEAIDRLSRFGGLRPPRLSCPSLPDLTRDRYTPGRGARHAYHPSGTCCRTVSG